MSVFDTLDADVVTHSALARLERLVELESPSDDEGRLRAVADHFAGELEALGAAVERVDVPGVGEHVRARIDGGEASHDPVVVLGHLDTVQPVGSFDPVFRVRDGRAEGPGTFDMKGGLACALEALARLAAAGAAPARPVIVLATCDEETGADHSLGLIEETVTGAHAVLVPEPPLPGGGAKTSRKGVGWYRLTVTGRAAHAGVAPEDGVNALVELAHQILAVRQLADPDTGTTVTIGHAGGGTAPNVVPAEAWAAVDLRFRTGDEGTRVDAALRALRPTLDGAAITVSGGINRPPMERTPGIARLYDRARALANQDGWDLAEGDSGGASDGSLAAALGVPVLDGIGPAGAGAHAAHEHVFVEDLPRRVGLYGRLLEGL
jgi:glutamate carboxypeptidase